MNYKIMYRIADVRPPEVDPAELQRLATIWEAVRAAAVSVGVSAQKSVNHVLSHNQGAATSDFEASVTGANSSIAQLEKLADGASVTRNAHRQAAATVFGTFVAMEAAAVFTYAQMRQAVRQVDILTAIRIGTWAKQQLNRISNHGRSSIDGIYGAVYLPATLTLREADSRGAVHPDVADAWGELDEQEQMAVLGAMADELTADWDDPPEVIFYTSQPPPYPPGVEPMPAGKSWENSRGVASGNTVYMNYDMLGDSQGELIHTMAHEIRHVEQNQIQAEYESLDQATRDDIRAGRVADPWGERGSSIDEAERFARREYANPRIEDRSIDGYYTHRPREVDARRAGTEFVDDLMPEDIERYKQAAGVG